MKDDALRGCALAAALALVTFACGLVIWIAAVRTQVRRVDLRPFSTYATTPTTTVPCCPAGVHGEGGGRP